MDRCVCRLVGWLVVCILCCCFLVESRCGELYIASMRARLLVVLVRVDVCRCVVW